MEHFTPLRSLLIQLLLSASIKKSVDDLKHDLKLVLLPSESSSSGNIASERTCHEKKFREYNSEPNEKVTSPKSIEFETKKMEEVFDFLRETKF